LSLDTDSGSDISLNGSLLAPLVTAEGALNADTFELMPTTVFNPGTVLTMIGHNGNDTFGNAANRINPHQNARLEIEGDDNTAIVPEALPDFDTIHLDASVLVAPVVFFAGVDQGFLDGSNVPPFGTVHYQDLEDIQFYDNGNGTPNSGSLTTIELGNLYVRTTVGNDTITLGRSSTLAPNDVIVTIAYPLGGSNVTRKYGPYPMGPIAPTGKIVVFGKEGNDRIAASATLGNRDVELHGDEGNDYLAGTGGNDLLIGGEGSDTIIAGNGNNVVWGDDEGDFDDIEQTLGVVYNDIITAGSGNDVLYGGTGNDSITAGFGNDTLYGGAGNDSMNGGSGNDLMRGSSGHDVMTGEAGDDIMLGSAGNDKLYGKVGNDLILGGAGIDSITGEGGNDILSGGLHDAYLEDDSDIDPAVNLASTQARDAALMAILAAWNGSASPTAFLATPSGTALTANLADDGVADSVLGAAGNDLYYAHNTPTVKATHDTHGPVEANDRVVFY
jgi:Ca2+-binding RTX toxin-like protein